MDGFYLLVAHLVGDYILQEDWQAKNKSNPLARDFSHTCVGDMSDDSAERCDDAFIEHARKSKIGHIACTVHCLLYTLAVWSFSFWWMPWWGLVVCFVCHWFMDRFRLASWWMKRVSGQSAFASGPLAPWSIIVVDNVIHLLTLAVISLFAGR